MSDFDFEAKGYRIVHEEEPLVTTVERGGGAVASSVQPGRVTAEKMVDGENLTFEASSREALAESIETFESAFKAVRGELQPDGSVKENENPEGFVLKIDEDDPMTGSEEQLASAEVAAEANAKLEETTRHLDNDRGEVRFNERDALKDAGVGKQTDEGVEISLEHPDDANRERLSGQDRNLNPTEVHQVDSPVAEEKREKLEAGVDPAIFTEDREGDGMEPLAGVDLEEAPALETDTDEPTESPLVEDSEPTILDAEGEPVDEDEDESEVDLTADAGDEDDEDLTVPELKAFLKERGLPVGGNKDELKARLDEAKASDES